MNRRTFLMAGSLMTAVEAAPNDRVVLGVIGSGGRGTFVMTMFQKDPAVRVGAICDVYEPNLENAVSIASKTAGTQPKTYRNYKELLADPDVQAVLIATPEHWHAQMVLDALAAGKDIYVEKPLCHTPEAGRATGGGGEEDQTASSRWACSAAATISTWRVATWWPGRLGNVRMVRSWWLNNYLGGGVATRLDGPLDWEQWQGPAERRPFDPNRFRQWRYYSEYAGGILADQGAHVFDGIHLLMSAGYPQAVNASAGKPHKAGVDQPESVVAIAEYAEDFMGVFSINYAAMQYKTRNDQLNQLDGDRARMDIGREELKVFPKGAEDAARHSRKRRRKGFGWATDLHVQNFLECVRTRQAAHRADERGVPGRAGGADGQPVAEAGPAAALGCGGQSGGVEQALACQ